jgi:K+-sensing histidine kinase KdpD
MVSLTLLSAQNLTERMETSRQQRLIEHVVQLQQVDAQKHRARIIVELVSDLPAVFVDRIMIEQVLTNLVRNGVEAMRTTRPAQRALTISARREAECRVVVRVVDQGPGVPACDQAQLFTPFFTTKPQGMGIGLAAFFDVCDFDSGAALLAQLEREPAPRAGACGCQSPLSDESDKRMRGVRIVRHGSRSTVATVDSDLVARQATRIHKGPRKWPFLLANRSQCAIARHAG